MSVLNCKTLWILQVPAGEPQITTSYLGFLYLLAVCINLLGLAREEMPPAQNTQLTFVDVGCFHLTDGKAVDIRRDNKLKKVNHKTFRA